MLIVCYGIHKYEKNKKEEAAEFSGSDAEKLLSSNKLDSLLSYCEKFYKHYPNDVHVNWYLAMAYYRKGDFGKAREYLLRVIELNPGWGSAAIPYLDEIEYVSNNDAAH